MNLAEAVGPVFLSGSPIRDSGGASGFKHIRVKSRGQRCGRRPIGAFPQATASPSRGGSAARMARPHLAESMRAYPVSPLVNSPKNDDARCLEPAA